MGAVIVAGLVSGSIYALIASGLSLVWGALGVFNFAHGALLMVGAFAAWWISDPAGLGLGLFVGIAGSMVLMIAAGIVLYGLLVRPWIAAGGEGRAMPPLRGYLMGRAARVLPAYWVALAASLGLLHAIGSGRAADPSQAPVFAFLLQFQSDATRKLVLPQAWSLAVELWFYALLPFAGGLALVLSCLGLRPVSRSSCAPRDGRPG